MAREHRPANAELVDAAAHQLGVITESTTTSGKPLGTSMAGHVDGDDLESLLDESVQGLGVQEALSSETVDHHERDTPPGDGQTDAMAIGQGEGVTSKAGRRHRFGPGRLRCRSGDGLSHARHVPLVFIASGGSDREA